MKTLRSFSLSLLLPLFSLPLFAQGELTVWQKDGQRASFPLSGVASVSFSVSESDPGGETKVVNGHHFVDLGLPSGLLWAACNVGASAPAEAGDYFSWGETRTKTSYNEGNSAWSGKDYPAAALREEHDAVTANWGAPCRLPTESEYRELVGNVDWSWTENYKGTGVAGRVAKSRKSANSVFFPAAGGYIGSKLDSYGKNGYYWISTARPNAEQTPDNRFACDFYYYSDIINPWTGWLFRWYGFPVRAVTK